ncbi:MAG: hypothetical protein KDD70_18995, partial [Bdellovibrionales bacterium]|nr:hypothetical protein [Bdellovibrionales bacterium]
TDESYLPPDKKIWASWNYRRERGEEGSEPLSVTYHMNRLQGLNCQKEYCVTLNPRREIAREHVIRGMTYMHPMYTTESVATQPKILEYNGTNSTFFCGSYLGWGFHEDAIRSSMSVVARLTGGAAREYLQSQPHGSRISGVKCQYGATGAI